MNSVMLYGVLGCTMSVLVYLTHLDNWPWFVLNSVLSVTRNVIGQTNMCCFSINEFYTAKFCNFVSLHVDKPNSLELRNMMHEKFNYLWLKRVKFMDYFFWSMLVVLIVIKLADLIYLIVVGDLF